LENKAMDRYATPPRTPTSSADRLFGSSTSPVCCALRMPTVRGWPSTSQARETRRRAGDARDDHDAAGDGHAGDARVPGEHALAFRVVHDGRHGDDDVILLDERALAAVHVLGRLHRGLLRVQCSPVRLCLMLMLTMKRLLVPCKVDLIAARNLGAPIRAARAARARGTMPSESKEAESKDDVSLEAHFRKFITSNMMWKKALEKFVENNAAAFDQEEEHKHQHHDLFVEYQEMCDVSLGLFMRKHKCSEDELARELLDRRADDLIDLLVAKGDFSRFTEMMRSRKLKALTSNFDAFHHETAAEAK
jgi:hypothetical protein